MALAGLCISHSGIDITLVSMQEGVRQESEGCSIDPIDITSPDSKMVAPTLASLSEKHPRELTVLSMSLQLKQKLKEKFLEAIGLTTVPKFTINHIEAYIGSMSDEDVKGQPCILFAEATSKMLTGHLITVHTRGGRPIVYPLYSEGITRPYQLAELVHQLATRAQTYGCEIRKCVLLDVPPDIIHHTTIQSALPSTCSLVVLAGPELSECAASYAFKNLVMLREPYDGEPDEMTDSCADVRFSVNRGCPQLLVGEYTVYPCYKKITFPEPIKQNSIVVEFLLGNHRTYPDNNKFKFAKIVLGGIQQDSETVTYFTVAVSLTVEYGYYGNYVYIYHGQDKGKTNAKLVLQIPPPFEGLAYDAVLALATSE